MVMVNTVKNNVAKNDVKKGRADALPFLCLITYDENRLTAKSHITCH